MAAATFNSLSPFRKKIKSKAKLAQLVFENDYIEIKELTDFMKNNNPNGFKKDASNQITDGFKNLFPMNVTNQTQPNENQDYFNQYLYSVKLKTENQNVQSDVWQNQSYLNILPHVYLQHKDNNNKLLDKGYDLDKKDGLFRFFRQFLILKSFFKT